MRDNRPVVELQFGHSILPVEAFERSLHLRPLGDIQTHHDATGTDHDGQDDDHEQGGALEAEAHVVDVREAALSSADRRAVLRMDLS